RDGRGPQARAQHGQRRPPRAAPRRRDRGRRRAPRPRLRTDRDGPGRTSQGWREPEVLHTTTARARGADALSHIAAAEEHAAHNYHPLPVVIAEGSGAWVTDVDGRRYLDALAGYSALNFGHRHPRLVARAERQLRRVTLTSRAFHHDQFAGFTAALAELTGKDKVLPMNSGAEAVETAIKLARRWGYLVRGVPEPEARIVVMAGNFH